MLHVCLLDSAARDLPALCGLRSRWEHGIVRDRSRFAPAGQGRGSPVIPPIGCWVRHDAGPALSEQCCMVGIAQGGLEEW